MESDSNVLLINTVFHIRKDEAILAWHSSVESEYTFLVSSSSVNDLIVRVKNKEVDQFLLLIASLCVDEVSATHVNRFSRCIFVY